MSLSHKFVKLLNLKNFIIFFFLISILKLPHNVYFIAKKNIDERLVHFHGYCGKESYGYVSKIYAQEENKNVHTYNFGDFPKDSLAWFFDLTKPYQENKIIILNYDKLNPKHSRYIKENFNEFKISDNYRDQCFLMEKN